MLTNVATTLINIVATVFELGINETDIYFIIHHIAMLTNVATTVINIATILINIVAIAFGLEINKKNVNFIIDHTAILTNIATTLTNIVATVFRLGINKKKCLFHYSSHCNIN